MPKSATPIGQVNKTSPSFWMRFDSYYISTARDGLEWVLWRKTHDNIGVLNSLAAIAFADKGEEPTHTAATYLLLDTLMKYARVHGEAPFRSVKRPGLLFS